jgi:hypothetical protein
MHSVIVVSISADKLSMLGLKGLHFPPVKVEIFWNVVRVRPPPIG